MSILLVRFAFWSGLVHGFPCCWALIVPKLFRNCSETFAPRHVKKSRNVFFPARETRDTSAKSESTCPRSIPKDF